jgi:nucleoside-diphosphate-sugar epimerase
MTRTVVVTGAGGFVGGETVRHLRDAGHRVVAVDRERPADPPGDRFVVADLLDAGEVFGVLADADPDGVVHLGTIPHPDAHPDAPVFRSNVMTSYAVLAAAEAVGVPRVCLASSVNAVGRTFQDVPMHVEYLPIDEEHPATPRDPYGLAKYVVEHVADGFGRRPGPPHTISTFRLPAVHDEAQIEGYRERSRTLAALRADADETAVPRFEYVHVADATRAIEQALTATFDGHETFWIAAPDVVFDAPTAAYVAAFYPDVRQRRSFEGHETLLDLSKARALLDWVPEHAVHHHD